jgi:CheY-like chemotaxis protein
MKTVLVVEDEFATAELLEAVLGERGYRVVTAANGLQGLQRLGEEPVPDLIITDFMMPILDGDGLIRRVRQSEAHRHIPIIIMSAVPESTVRQRVQEYAAFIRKPFRLAAMLALVASVLAN